MSKEDKAKLLESKLEKLVDRMEYEKTDQALGGDGDGDGGGDSAAAADGGFGIGAEA